MARVVVRTPNAWYLRVDRPDKPDDMIPLSPLGAATDEKVALIEALISATTGEALSRKPRGRPAKGSAPATAENPVVEAMRLLMGQGFVPSPSVLPVAAEAPTPAGCIEWYLGSLEKTHAANTIGCLKGNLMRALRELGNNWESWISTSPKNGVWGWISGLTIETTPPTPMKESSRSAYVKSLHAFRAVCEGSVEKIDGKALALIPDFMPKKFRPASKTPTELLRGGISKAVENIQPFTLDEIRTILRSVDATGGPAYLRFVIHALAKTGMNPSDVYSMLAKGSGSWEWDREDGVVWYHSARTKTATAIDVPIAPSLAALLRPYRDGTGIRLNVQIARHESWKQRFADLCDLCGVKRLHYKGLGRFRHAFNATMEQRLGVPESIRESLMSHQLKKNGRINTTYTSAESSLMVKAIKEFDALLCPVAAAASA